MAFITTDDLNTHMYSEIITTISRDDLELLEEAIEAAIGEAIGYLQRYNTDDLFDKVDDDRDKTLLMYVKDITVWHFLAVANPNTDIDYREKRYTNAIDWLKKIQAGKVSPKGWVLSTSTNANEPYLITSDPKRTTNF